MIGNVGALDFEVGATGEKGALAFLIAQAISPPPGGGGGGSSGDLRIFPIANTTVPTVLGRRFPTT